MAVLLMSVPPTEKNGTRMNKGASIHPVKGMLGSFVGNLCHCCPHKADC